MSYRYEKKPKRTWPDPVPVSVGRKLERPDPWSVGRLPLAPQFRLRAVAWGVLLALVLGLASLGALCKLENRFADAGNYSNLHERPVFEMFDTEREPPSVSNLSRYQTIEGTTIAPALFYKAQDSSGSWIGEYGDTLTESGSGSSPTYGAGAPTMGTDVSVDYVGGKCHEGISIPDVGTDDFVVATMFRHPGSIYPRIFSMMDASGYGLEMFCSTSSVTVRMRDADGTLINISTIVATMVGGCWYYLEAHAHRAGNMRIWLQGAVNNNGAISTANKSLTAGTLKIGGGLVGSSPEMVGPIAFFGLWHAPGWFTTHAHDDIATANFRAVTGFRPQRSAIGRDAAPVTSQRNSCATVEKYNETTGETEYYTVGEHWLRCMRWLDASGRVVTVFVPEAEGENKILQSEDMATTWTELDAGDTTGASTLVADSTDGDHGVSQAVTVTAASWVFWCEATKGDHDWLYMSDDTVANCTAYFDLDTPVAGTFGAGATGGVVDLGDRVKCWMTFTGTAAAHTFKLQTADSDGDKSIQGDGSTVNTTIHRVQLELGTYPSSYVKTTTAAASRLKDELIMTGLANVGGVGSEQQGAVVLDALIRQHSPEWRYFLDIAADGSNRIVFYKTNNLGITPRMYITDGGVVQAVSNGTSDVEDNDTHRIGLAWKTNKAELWCDGSMEAIDTTCTIPDALSHIGVGCSYTGIAQTSAIGIRRIQVYRRYQHDMAQLTRLAA